MKMMAIDGQAFNEGSKKLLVVLILTVAWLLAFCSRLFSVIRFESIIHEFDPWFNYRATRELVEHDFYHFLNWFDDSAWYPLGRIVGGTVYPGLMVTSGSLHYILNSLNITVHIRDICVFLAPLFSGLTAICTFLLTREVWDEGAGLFAACFMAIVPGYVSRSVAGSYDNEGIAIFALMLTYFLWIRSMKTGSVFWSALAALAYFYMVSAWGGYVFIINLIPIHVFVLVLMGRFSSRLYVAYTTFYILGLMLSMQIPFVGFQPIRSSEHLAAHGVFLLLHAYMFLTFLRDHMSWETFKDLFVGLVFAAGGVVAISAVFLTWAGYLAPWSGRFYSLFDTSYARIHIPIIASVSEHQPPTWSSMFTDMHMLLIAFPAGVWTCYRKLTDEVVFVLLYAITASYFAGVMVRLILTLTPIVCVVAAITFSRTATVYLADTLVAPIKESEMWFLDPDEREAIEAKELAKELASSSPASASSVRPLLSSVATTSGSRSATSSSSSSGADAATSEDTAGGARRTATASEVEAAMQFPRNFVLGLMMLLLLFFAVHCIWVTGNHYSSPSVVLESWNRDGTRNILDDFREAYFWLRQNTHPQSRVMAWWDYGYQIAGFAKRTTIVDNNTWNNSHIALVGKAMSSTESNAFQLLQMLDVDYVLVIFGGVIGYGGDDINKFLWMVRIAQGEHPDEIKESNYFNTKGEYRIDSTVSDTMKNSLMYKLSYHDFGKLQTLADQPNGFDRTRGTEIGMKDVELSHLEEAYTSEHWLVRIYRVKPVVNREESTLVRRSTKLKKKMVYKAMKTESRQRGYIKNKQRVVRGKGRKRPAQSSAPGVS